MAAGLGTRLRPMTNRIPKALVEYQGLPLLEHVLKKISESGFKKIIINVHHFGDQIIKFVKNFRDSQIEIVISDERSKLLNTGGGLKKASEYFSNSPLLVYNVDILTNADLNLFWEYHIKHISLATLMVKERQTSRYLLFNDDMILSGWKSALTGEEIVVRKINNPIQLAFSAIYIVQPEFIDQLPPVAPYPIMPEILKFAEKKEIRGYRHDQDEWTDMGKPESYSV